MFEPDNGVLNPHLRDMLCRNYYVNKLTVIVKQESIYLWCRRYYEINA